VPENSQPSSIDVVAGALPAIFVWRLERRAELDDDFSEAGCAVADLIACFRPFQRTW